MRSIGLIVFTLLLFLTNLFGQPTFTDQTRLFKKNFPTRSVFPGGMADINGDLIDDLIILDKGNILKYIKSTGRNFSLELTDSIFISPNKNWSLTLGDLNNDGVNEVVMAGETNLLNIATKVDNKLTKKAITAVFFAQAGTTIDVNNDGWLDYFVCNDEGYSRFYINDGNGNLFLKPVINFSLDDSSDGSGNYGAEWADVNGDMLPDLYISKCRSAATSPSDPRRINKLFINKGNGVFEERAKAFNMNSGHQTWTTTFGDIDNDGDQDAIIINHYGPHALMQNINNQFFTEIALDSPLNSFGFQSIMRDFDNDGFLDIFIVGVEGTMLLHNKGNRKFSIIQNIIGRNSARSVSVGDLNDDGFIDISAHLSEPVNLVGLKDDELWLNDGNLNHFVKFNLEGVNSNKSGIGSKIDIFGPWGRQTRTVKGGESFGIFNSFQQHFGLGSHTKIDSILVFWPSGKKDKYLNLETDKTYLVQEGRCISSVITISSEVQFFTNQPVLITAPPAMASYLWNSGNTSSSISIQKEGSYHVKMKNASGCTVVSKPVVVKSGCFTPNVKLLNEASEIKLCSGQVLELKALDAKSYLWSTGQTSQSIKISEQGNYFLNATDFCGNTKFDQISVTYSSINFVTKNDTVKTGEKAKLISSNKNTHWFESSNQQSPIFIGDTLVLTSISNSKTYFAKVVDIVDMKVTKIGLKDFPTTNFYGANSTAGNLVFNVLMKCTIKSVKVNTDTEGIRNIIIRNSKGDTIFRKEILIKSGIQILELNAVVEPGSFYEMATDENVNFKSFGYKSPRLVRTFNETAYPYLLENTISIQSSSFGAIYYYYFYDWEIIHDIVTCESPFKQVSVIVLSSTPTIDAQLLEKIEFYPNPFENIVNIISDNNVNIKSLLISNIQGQIVNKIEGINIKSIDLSHQKPGIYFINVQTEKSIYIFKIIKI